MNRLLRLRCAQISAGRHLLPLRCFYNFLKDPLCSLFLPVVIKVLPISRRFTPVITVTTFLSRGKFSTLAPEVAVPWCALLNP